MKNLQTLLNSKGYNLTVDGVAGPKTLAATQDWLVKEHQRLGYTWFPNNIIAVRIDGVFTDRFSDIAAVIKDGKVKEVLEWTTKPGSYYVKNPLTVGGITGTGVIKEGQYIDSHQFTTAPNKYQHPYFKQIGNLTVYRDGNKDNKLDKNIKQFAPTWYAFLLHSMGKGFNIYNWSAGCNGSPIMPWLSKVCPYFTEGQKINFTILEA